MFTMLQNDVQLRITTKYLLESRQYELGLGLVQSTPHLVAAPEMDPGFILRAVMSFLQKQEKGTALGSRVWLNSGLTHLK